MTLSLRTKIIAGVAFAIALVVFGFCERHAGEKVGAFNQEIKASAVVVQARKADVAAQVKKSVAKRTEYNAARAKVQVKGDSVIADGQRLDLPSVAAALIKADTLSVQDSTSLVKQDLLVAALDHHIDLVQEQKKPRIGVKTGIAIGVVGTVALVYVAVKIVRAIGHK